MDDIILERLAWIDIEFYDIYIYVYIIYVIRNYLYLYPNERYFRFGRR